MDQLIGLWIELKHLQLTIFSRLFGSLELTTEFDVFAIGVVERNWPEPSPQASDRNGILPNEVGLTKHVHVIDDEPEARFQAGVLKIDKKEVHMYI